MLAPSVPGLWPRLSSSGLGLCADAGGPAIPRAGSASMATGELGPGALCPQPEAPRPRGTGVPSLISSVHSGLTPCPSWHAATQGPLE